MAPKIFKDIVVFQQFKCPVESGSILQTILIFPILQYSEADNVRNISPVFYVQVSFMLFG